MIITSPDSLESNNIKPLNLLLIDFEDSFTYNIVSEFYELAVNVKVVNYKLVLPLLEKIISSKVGHYGIDGLFLGPGPGSPGKYRLLYPAIRKILEFKILPVMGICLGHQILLNIKGLNCESSSNILHGQSIELDFSVWQHLFTNFRQKDNFKEVVTRYNSLCIKDSPKLYEIGDLVLLSKDQEVMGLYNKRHMSMQFHPESVGTNCPSIFFKLFINFMYNFDYDNFSQN